MEYDVAKAIERIEDELIYSIIRNLKRHRAEETEEGFNWEMWQVKQLQSLNKFKKDNLKYKPKFAKLNKQIEELLIDMATDGSLDQEKAILEAIKKGYKPPKRSSNKLDATFFKYNSKKLEALISETSKNMAKAETAILRMAHDKYRSIIFDAQMYAATGVGTYEKAVDMATRDFLSAGINCVEYSNGARHTLSNYARMAIRTASKRAYLQGEGEQRKEWGIHTVIVNKRGNPCPKCLPFVGKVLIDDVWSGGSKKDGDYMLMSSAIAAGLYHPNCKDSHTTYFEGLTTRGASFTKKEINRIEKEYAEEQKRIYTQSQAKKYKRLRDNSLDEENKAKYSTKAKKRDIYSSQFYRGVTRGEEKEFNTLYVKNIKTKKVMTYNSDIYVSDKAEIKPKALHMINKNTEDAIKHLGLSLENKPIIVILDTSEMPTAFGIYNAIENVVYYAVDINEKYHKHHIGSIEYHEMVHFLQAERYRSKGKTITYENYKEYQKEMLKTCKKNIDSFGIDEYNVNEISDYADDAYEINRFDEVEAEHLTKERFGGK